MYDTFIITNRFHFLKAWIRNSIESNSVSTTTKKNNEHIQRQVIWSWGKSTSDLLLHHQLLYQMKPADQVLWTKPDAILHKSQPNQIFIIKICLYEQHAHIHLILWTVKNHDRAIYLRVFVTIQCFFSSSQSNAHYNITGFFVLSKMRIKNMHTLSSCVKHSCLVVCLFFCRA